LPVGGGDEVKQTNEIGMVIPVLESLEALDIAGKTVTADALLTQRKFAEYLIEHDAHYVFTVKDNQPTLREDIRLIFEDRGRPDFSESPALAHGRIEQRSIWTTTRLNDYLDFPGVGQVFAIERPTIEKKTGKPSAETVYGVTSHTPATADAAGVLAFNRGHWTVENGCHYILDWNWDEDRCTIRTGHGPENVTALRRFAIGVIKSKSRDTVSATIQRLARSVRLVFDYLRMTENSRNRPQPLQAQPA
jgi:predicted transposase YbfD/YdcC